MTIQLQMGLMRTSRFIVLVTLLCVSALISSEERLITEEVFLTRLVDPATGKIDGDMVRVCVTCICICSNLHTFSTYVHDRLFFLTCRSRFRLKN